MMFWLVVDLPLWKIWVRQLGWGHSQHMGKNVPIHQPMFDLLFSGYQRSRSSTPQWPWRRLLRPPVPSTRCECCDGRPMATWSSCRPGARESIQWPFENFRNWLISGTYHRKKAYCSGLCKGIYLENMVLYCTDLYSAPILSRNSMKFPLMGTHFLGISKFTARVSILRWSNLDLRVPIWGNPQNHTLEDGFGTWLGTLIFNDNDKHFVQLRYASLFIRLGKVLSSINRGNSPGPC